jgi:hypothetical protein
VLFEKGPEKLFGEPQTQRQRDNPVKAMPAILYNSKKQGKLFPGTIAPKAQNFLSGTSLAY